jgi:drug/metabolite transporter (DMT)-like permease
MSFLLALVAIAFFSSFAVLSAQLGALPFMQLTALALGIGGLGNLWTCRSWRVPWRTFAIAVAGLFGYHALLFKAFALAPTALVEVNLINYLWPLFLVLLTPLFMGGGLKPHHVLGAVLGFLGAALAIGGSGVALSSQHLAGYACAFGAALTWPTYTLMCKRLPPFPSAAVPGFCLASGLLAAALATAQGASWSALSRLTGTQWACLVVLGLGSEGVAFIAWDAAIKRGDPRVIGSLAYLTPLCSTAALAIGGGYALGWHAALALALIVAGAAIGALDTFRRSG